MNGVWRRLPLGEVLNFQRGYDITRREQRPGDVPVVSSGGVSSYHDEAISSGPGVVIGRKGTLGRTFFLSGPYWPHDTTLWVTDFKGNDERFVYYLLRSLDFRRFDVGSANPTLNRNHIHPLEVALPPIEQQRGIAATLGALDDKIASNRRVQDLCLRLATSRYLAAVSDDARRIPLSATGHWLSGGTPSTEEPDYWGGELPWISAASLKDFFVWTSDRKLTSLGRDQARVVSKGTVLLVVRGMSLKTELRLGVTQRDVAFGQDIKAIVPVGVAAATLACALQTDRARILELVDEAGHGTGRLQTDRLERFEISLPRDPSIDEELQGLIDRGSAAAVESRTLESLRDALLPELLSGRIRVPEAREAVTNSV
jgi:type I restriction enzyme, S subunit